jgi:hypothetical protein
LNDVSDEKLTRELNNRFVERTEIRPNRVVFHDSNEMRDLLGVGTQLKEQKVIDRRNGKPAIAPVPAQVPPAMLTAPGFDLSSSQANGSMAKEEIPT